MTLSLVCMSHSPLLNFNDPGAEVRAEMDAVFDTVRAFVAEVDPTLVVSFGPDHYNGFFYDLMPPYAICYAATAVGDFDTASGPLDVPEAIAAGMAEHLAANRIDIAISRGAQLDHGAVQVPELILGGIDKYRTVPIFVNGVAAPFVPMDRVRVMGQAVGEYLAGLDERVLVIGSGGLSHDPPVPRWVSASPAQREFLLAGRNPTPEAREARQQRTIATGQAFARGEADIMDLNPAWDQAFMDACEADDLSVFDSYNAEDMAKAAGNSAHEVRCWVAACAATRAAGPYRVGYRYYRAIPEYIAGFGALTATTV